MSKPLGTNEFSRTIDMDDQQLLVFDDRAGTRVQVLYGGLWLTEERSLDDRFAGAGQWLLLEHGGRAVAEARGLSRVRIVETVPRTAARWRDAVRAWWPSRLALPAKSLATVLALVLGIGLPDMLARRFQGTPSASGDGEVVSALRSQAAPQLAQATVVPAPGALTATGTGRHA